VIDPAYIRIMARYNRWQNMSLCGATETLSDEERRADLSRTIRRHLEHVPNKLTDFFDQNMLQLVELERFLFDQMIPSDRETL
jgi:uncharacterized damage-inducible protein DinB